MQKIFSIVVLASAVFLAACGASSSEGTGATAEKAKLAELKKQKEGIDWKQLLLNSIQLRPNLKMPSW
jgi:major membrane immunogen (membrane-anchored lipoprotein)